MSRLIRIRGAFGGSLVERFVRGLTNPSAMCVDRLRRQFRRDRAEGAL
jgi:hypothetical protein